MPTRMRNGITVHITSTAVFSWNCSARCPTDLRCFQIAYSMAPKTNTKMTAQIARMMLCSV